MLKLITIKHLIATGASIVLFSWLELETSGRGLVFFARNPLSNLLQPPQSEEQLEQVQENVTTVLGHHMKSIEHLELQPWQKETIQRVHDMGPHETYHSMDYSSVFPHFVLLLLWRTGQEGFQTRKYQRAHQQSAFVSR
jgi:hypothetical protein